MTEQIRYFLETDQKIVGDGAFAIRRRTSSLKSGIASVKFRKGVLDTVCLSEEEKIDFILSLINKMEHRIEEEERLEER